MPPKAYRIIHTKKSRFMQTTVIVLLLALFLFLFIQSSFFNCKEAIIAGNEWLDKEYILENANVPIGNNLFYIDEKHIEDRLRVLPMIQEVKVEKRLPGTLYIYIKEREPASLVVAQEKFILVDIKGFYIQDVESIREFSNLPLITGLVLEENLPYGQKIDNKALKAALELSEQIWDENSIYFNEINVSSGENDIWLYTNEGIMVKIGDSKNIHEKLAVFEKLYLKQREEGNLSLLEYIDISFAGLPVIKYK
ncbi:cell division protein FtsQ/DivIB [Desulfitibacter alkalitolerans]|uniref:cell division protein FtsQ/DivIB n=1 Tax=Desulfitibacter alkalitolerans TaxID=264641 RepID=UPI000487396E|nr:FtsQ-type POTRA domain-containing protein [Desulfitibacter alkalitolerans]